MKVPFEGPLDSPIWIVGEAPGAEEELQGRPFVGASGRELTNMLNQAGIARTSCRVCNVFKTRPPDNDISHFVAKRKRAPWPDAVQFQGRWVRGDQFPDLQDLLAEVRTHRPR
jgi:uracil-DNA glycosylase family 4